MIPRRCRVVASAGGVIRSHEARDKRHGEPEGIEEQDNEGDQDHEIDSHMVRRRERHDDQERSRRDDAARVKGRDLGVEEAEADDQQAQRERGRGHQQVCAAPVALGLLEDGSDPSIVVLDGAWPFFRRRGLVRRDPP